MADIGQINGVMYTTDDFLPAQYANRLYALIGDMFDHVANKFALTASASLAIGTGAKSFTITNNLSGSNVQLSPGQYVYARPTGYLGGTPQFKTAWMIGTVTSVTSSNVTINAAIARGSGTYGSWTLTPIGDVLATFTSPLPVAQGGSAVTTASAARAMIGAPDPTSAMQPFFEDFCGAWAAFDAASYVSESLYVTTVNDPALLYNVVNNPASGGVFIPCAQAVYFGDNTIYNRVGRTGSGGGGSTGGNPGGGANVVPVSLQNDWASHPGVIGMSGTSAGSRVSLGLLGADSALVPQMSDKNLWEFPVTGDVAEFGFMFPTNEGFDTDNTGGVSFGFFPKSLSGYGVFINIGNKNSIPFGNVDSLGYGADPSTYNPMALAVASTQTGVTTSTFWVDNAGQTTPLVILPGQWYKVRMTPTSVTVYQNGAILAKTITGWTNPTMGVTKGSSLNMFYYKDGGNKKVTVLMDYMYFRHNVTR